MEWAKWDTQPTGPNVTTCLQINGENVTLVLLKPTQEVETGENGENRDSDVVEEPSHCSMAAPSHGVPSHVTTNVPEKFNTLPPPPQINKKRNI